MIRRRFLVGMLCCFEVAAAQVPGRHPVLGMGSYSERRSDVFSFVHNQAALAFLKKPSVAFFSERRFMLNELADHRCVLSIPLPPGAFGISLSRFGFTNYSVSNAGIAYGRRLASHISLGLQLNYFTMSIPGLGRSSAGSAELGLLLKLSDRLHAGIHAANPGGMHFSNNENLPDRYTVGMGYDISDRFYFYTELQKEELQPICVNAGLHYALSSLAFVRAGVSTDLNVLWWSAGCLLGFLRLDMTLKYQQPLGISPALTILCYLKGRGT